MNKKFLLFAAIMLLLGGGASAKDYVLTSPNGNLRVGISNGVTISVCQQGSELFSVKAALNGMEGKVTGMSTAKVQREHIVSPFYRQPQFTTAYCQANVKLGGGFGLHVRAYDEGVAYRFYTTRRGETVVKDETAVFAFPDSDPAFRVLRFCGAGRGRGAGDRHP